MMTNPSEKINSILQTLPEGVRLVAVSNGDINSHEPDVASHRHLWNGSALVILRSGRSPSKVVFKTTSEAYNPVTTVLQTKTKR